MTRTLTFAALALSGGAFLAIQAPINARLRDLLRVSPYSSALVSVLVSALVLIAIVVALGHGGEVTRSLGAPWWAYLGGACGVVFLVASLVVVSHQGVTLTFVAVVAGQLAAATVIDRLGWIGTNRIDFGWERAGAVVLMSLALALLLLEGLQRR